VQAEIYPNPSSGRASISYNLPLEESVQLRIYNQRGMLIQETSLNNAHQGNNSQSVDLSSQAAGIYFCSLVTAESVKTIRMLVVK
jgi:hypothetical protein